MREANFNLRRFVLISLTPPVAIGSSEDRTVRPSSTRRHRLDRRLHKCNFYRPHIRDVCVL